MVQQRMRRKKLKLLLDEVRHLVRAPRERAELASKLHDEAKPDAAARLATIVLEVGAGDQRWKKPEPEMTLSDSAEKKEVGAEAKEEKKNAESVDGEKA